MNFKILSDIHLNNSRLNNYILINNINDSILI